MGDDPLFRKLISAPAFQRLRAIRFLGAIDYRLVPHPNGRRGATRYSRYEHSLGVFRLAHLYANEVELSARDRRIVSVAALLHDIGHPPLSHSMEAAFKKTLDIDHHQATLDIIFGRAPLGKEVYAVLRENHINVEEVATLVTGDCDRFDGFFGGPINFDTIEGVLRSWEYIGSASSTPASVTLAAIRRSTPAHRQTVDDFWNYKNEVYNRLIHSATGILSDYACCLFLERALEQVDTRYYFGTERSLFRKLPGLSHLLRSPTFEAEVSQMIDHPIAYEARHYYVDENADFVARQDNLRYRQTRTPSLLPTERWQGQALAGTVQQPTFTQWLF